MKTMQKVIASGSQKFKIDGYASQALSSARWLKGFGAKKYYNAKNYSRDN